MAYRQLLLWQCWYRLGELALSFIDVNYAEGCFTQACYVYERLYPTRYLLAYVYYLQQRYAESLDLILHIIDACPLIFQDLDFIEQIPSHPAYQKQLDEAKQRLKNLFQCF